MRKSIFFFIYMLGILLLIHQPTMLVDQNLLQIAFETNLPHNDICIINSDSTEEHCLMRTDQAHDYGSVWSPDGRFIVYHSIEEPVGLGASSTYIHDLENETTVKLSEPWQISDWSPDGKFLLGTKFDEQGSEIYIVRPDGEEAVQLTNNQVADSQPKWSPDGSQIAYLAGLPDANLMLITASGENPQALTTDLRVSLEVQPQWSPDGKTIAFVVNGDFIKQSQTSEIYTVASDGTNLRQLTDTGGVTLNPRWSPDGTRLVFYGYKVDAFDDMGDPTSLRTEVFRINRDGSDLLNLTQSTGLDYHPEWSPDGEWIAFASTRESPGIFIMRPDGTGLQMVTNEPPYSEGGREAHNPVWRPQP